MKCQADIDFGTLSFFGDEEMKLYFLVGRVENGTRMYIGDFSQVGGLPWGTFCLFRFQNFSQGNNHFSEISILVGSDIINVFS